MNNAIFPFRIRPDHFDRMMRVYRRFLGDRIPVEVIAQEENLSIPTVYRDISKARELTHQVALRDVAQVQTEAVLARQHIQEKALEDRSYADLDDSTGRAALLKVVAEQQLAIEEIMGIRKKDDTVLQPPAQVVVFQVAGKRPKSLQEMSDDELEELHDELTVQTNGHMLEGEAKEV